MRFSPFRTNGHSEPLIQPGPVVGDMAVIRTVIGYAPAPPALLQGADQVAESYPVATDPSAIVPVAGGAPTQLAPVPLPIEIFDADELLG